MAGEDRSPVVSGQFEQPGPDRKPGCLVQKGRSRKVGAYASPCRDCTGPKPFRPFVPISRSCPGAVSLRAVECFRASQKLGDYPVTYPALNKRPPLVLSLW